MGPARRVQWLLQRVVMETNKNYFLVGLFIIATTIIALMFSIWLTTRGRGNYAHYYIRFAESVSGLSVSSPVKFRGVEVGNVEQIVIDSHDTRLIRVDIHILRTTPVKTDTVASLKLQGITGTVFIELTGGSPGAPDLLSQTKEDSTPEIRAEQSSIDAIVNRLPLLIEKATHIVDQINAVLNDQNIAALDRVITSLSDGHLEILLKDSSAAAAHLNHTSLQADALLRELTATARNMRVLSESLKEKPSRIIFPDKEKGIPAP